LLEWIEAHCRATGTAPTALGVQVLNDPRFVSGLREGRSPRLKTEARVRAYLEAAIRTARNAGSAVSRIPERIASALSGMSESEIDAPPPERDEELIRRVAETLMRGGSDAERLRVVIDALASAK